MRFIRLGVLFVGAFLASTGFFHARDWVLKKYRKGKPGEIKFVRHTNKICKAHVQMKKICSEEIRKIDPTFECSYGIVQWMEKFFDSTKDTLDIMIYHVTANVFKDAIIRASQRGVKVRVIADYRMSKEKGSAIGKLIESGIPVIIDPKSKMMHRKSAISDKSCVFMGTGNWTMQALAGNFDMWNQVWDPDIVKGYVEEFDYQWNKDRTQDIC